VVIEHRAPVVGPDTTSYVTAVTDKEFNTEGVVYIPEGEVEGGLVKLTGSHWIKGLELRSAAYAGQYTSPPKAEPGGKVKMASNTTYGSSPASESGLDYQYAFDILRGVLYYCAWQTFLTKFRQEVRASVTTRLLMSSEDSDVEVDEETGRGWICPGHVCSIQKGVTAPQAEIEGEEDTQGVFDMYVTTVEHTIDCQNNRARTEIIGRYARPPGGFPDVAVNGTCNPIYGVSAEEEEPEEGAAEGEAGADEEEALEIIIEV
jgi:hypothetical protein